MPSKTNRQLIIGLVGLFGLASAQAEIHGAGGGTGPFSAVMESDGGLATHTIYRPLDLQAFGANQRLPIVSWGNGGCVNAGDAQRNFLQEIASHGFLVIAVGPVRGPRNEQSGAARDLGDTHSVQLADAIDWAIAENTRAGSQYAGKLATDAIALMGYSCGGLQALAQSGDERVKTLVLWNSGVIAAEDPRAAAMEVGKDILKSLSMPVAYIAGGPSDIAYGNSVDDVSRIEGVPLFFGNIDVSHSGTYAEPNGGAFGQVGSAWLQWQLKGDMTSAKIFVGADCGLCQDPAWTVEKKNIN
jgi:hypothetical protein